MSLETFLESIKTKVEQYVTDGVDFVEDEAEVAWGAVEPVLTALPANIWAALKPLAAEAVAEVEAGTASAETIGATLLNKAETAGIGELEALPEKLFTAAVSALIAAV